MADDRAVAEQLAHYRAALAALYAEQRDDASERRALEEQARRELTALPLRSLDAQAVAARVRLNDACQALAGAYDADLPAYVARLDALDGDLPAFLAAAREAANTSEPRCALIGACENELDSKAFSKASGEDFE